MRSDIHRHNYVMVNVEDRPQITFDDRSVDRAAIACGEPVDLVRTQTRIERIRSEDDECGARTLLLRCRQVLQTAPERACRPEAILHVFFENGSFSAVSIHQTTRFGIGHAFSERLRNPRIVILDDKPCDLRPFVSRQSFKLLDQLRSAHPANLDKRAERSNE